MFQVFVRMTGWVAQPGWGTAGRQLKDTLNYLGSRIGDPTGVTFQRSKGISPPIVDLLAYQHCRPFGVSS